jgi:hypothetical protein
MTVRIPGQAGWRQTNRSDTIGSLWSTWNIDLQSNLGKVRVTPRFKVNTTSLNNCPVAIVRYGTRVYTLAGTTIYRNTNDSGLPTDPFVADDSTSFSTDYSSDYSDLKVWENVLWATTPSKLRRLSNPNGGTWSADQINLSSNHPHIMCVFPKVNKLYILDATLIRSANSLTSYNTFGDSFILQRQTGHDFTDIKATSNFLWVAQGAPLSADGPITGRILQWDGIKAQPTRIFDIPGTRSIVALVTDEERDSVFAFGDNGVLYSFNGSGFSEVGRLPYTNHIPLSPILVNNKFVHPNGVKFTKEGTVLALVNNINSDNAGTIEENLPSGVWEWSRQNGFVHRQPLTYDPISSAITDYGQNRVSRVGALENMNIYSTASGRDGEYMAGATLFTNASSTASSIFYDNSIDTVQKYGYFVTTEIFSQNIEDAWKRVYLRHKKLLNSSDKMVVKARTEDAVPTEFTLTWVNTTTFTTTSSALDGRIGDEVEIVQGTGGGKCAHIVSVTNNAGTRTVVLDETFTGVTTGTAKARVQNWKKLAEQTKRNTQKLVVSSELKSVWVQFKVCMQFTGKNEIYDAIIANSPQEKMI